jgi:hypothetical protein
MPSSRLLLVVLGCGASLTVTSPAQHQHYDKATPPAKEGVAGSASPAPERSSIARSNDRQITEATRFEVLDTDGDDRISRSEFTLAPNLPVRAASETNKAGDEAREPRGRIAAGTTDSNFSSPNPNTSEKFDRIDTDKDGFLNRAELAMHHSTLPLK